MKKLFFAIVMTFCSQVISAQTENGFKEVEVLDSFDINPFTYFMDAPILAAGIHTMYMGQVVGAWKK